MNSETTVKSETDYETNAIAFLRKWGIRFKVEFVDESCPPFCDDKDGRHIHGHKHKVTMTRNGRRIQFHFWNSFNDAQMRKEPSVYDVLACASSDLHCPQTFEDFCAEYGYDEDSRQAEKTFKLCLAQSERLNRIFDGEEIQAELGTIN
jgi:hypothetical protein